MSKMLEMSEMSDMFALLIMLGKLVDDQLWNNYGKVIQQLSTVYGTISKPSAVIPRKYNNIIACNFLYVGENILSI